MRRIEKEEKRMAQLVIPWRYWTVPRGGRTDGHRAVIFSFISFY